jgi:flagellar biosynthesis protein FlhF
MQVKTFTGSSTKEIMARIKDELGPDAIILSNQKTSRGGTTCYEIMAALDAPPSSPQVEDIAPLREGNALMQMREEWSQLRKQLMAVLTPQLDVGALSPRQQVVMEYLEREGVRQDVLISLWERFRRQPDTPTLSTMNDMIAVRPWLDTAWPQKIHFFAGPYGGGKSSTVLRLSLALKKVRPNARILIVNADRSKAKVACISDIMRNYPACPTENSTAPNTGQILKTTRRTTTWCLSIFQGCPAAKISTIGFMKCLAGFTQRARSPCAQPALCKWAGG